MSLETIPPGSRVLIDANILIYARRGMSEQCRGLLERCAQREVSGVLRACVAARERAGAMRTSRLHESGGGPPHSKS